MKIQYNILGLLIIFLLSCSSEGDNIPDKLYGKVDVTVSVTLPEPEVVDASTRAYTDTDIKNVDVLVFDENDNFLERVQVDDDKLINIHNGVSFTVRLDATPHKRTLHLVTNGRKDNVTDRLNFEELGGGMQEVLAISSLTTASIQSIDEGESTLINNIMPLIMWGRLELNSGINIVTKVDGVKLLRTAACINVRKGIPTQSNGLEDFYIEGITVQNGAAQGFLAPVNCTGPVVTPSTANPVPGVSYLDYNKGWVYASEPSLYIYERNCVANDYMGVIIKAKYKGKLGYYKVVMTEGGNPLDVIRNHRYILTIVEVNGPGYSDVATATASAPSNDLKVELVDEDKDFSFNVADGQYRMSSTNNVLNLYGKAATISNLEICTVYSSRNIAPTLSLPAGVTWLSNLSTQSIGGNKYIVVGNFNTSISSPVSTVLTMTCDNLSLPVNINWDPVISSQKDADSYVLDLVGTTDKNWNIQVVDPTVTNWLFLHPTANLPSAYPGGTGMVTQLSSKYASHAYMHVAIKGNVRGTAMKTYTSGGEPKVSKIVFIQ